jgi:hypothetical protein
MSNQRRCVADEAVHPPLEGHIAKTSPHLLAVGPISGPATLTLDNGMTFVMSDIPPILILGPPLQRTIFVLDELFFRSRHLSASPQGSAPLCHFG